MISVTADVTNLNRDLATYARLARISIQDAVLKQGLKVTIGAKGVQGWTQRLKTITPAKGAITGERYAALDAGRGIRVRKSARQWAEGKLLRYKGAFQDPITKKIMRQTKKGIVSGGRTRKGLNVQALAVRRELSLRERSRGFLSYGVMMRGDGWNLAQLAATIPPGATQARRQKRFRGRARQLLSEANLGVANNGASADAILTWGSPETELGAGLLQPRPMAFLSQSIRDAHADMMTYIQRKLREAKGKARLT